MFDQIFKRPYTIRKHTNAPLLKQRLIYLQHWIDRDASSNTLKECAYYLLRVTEFLNLKINTAVITTEEIEEAANKWARYQSNHPQKRAVFSENSRNRFIWHATHWLEMLNRLKRPPEIIVPLFHKIFERPHAIKKHTNAPLLEERLMYLQYWANGGTSTGTLRELSEYLLLIMDNMKFYQVRKIELEEIEEAADKWANQRSRYYRKQIICPKYSKARFMRKASGWFKLLGCLRLPEKMTLPFEEQLNQYTTYMRNEQGLAETTIKLRLRFLQDFLIEVANTCGSLGEITPLTVDVVLIRPAAKV